MSLIEIFTDYVQHKKSLKEYVEIRRTIRERGEFNDESLIRAQENLIRLRQESPEIYEGMYDVLSRIYERNHGLTIEYPIDFVHQILRMYSNSLSPYQIYEEYKRMLDHYHHDI